MTNRHWLKQEVPKWVEENLVTQENGKKLLAQYKKENPIAYKEAFFILSVVCILGGCFLLGAGLWESLSQDERFTLALTPLVISFALMLLVVFLDKKIPDGPVEKEVFSAAEATDDMLNFDGISDSEKGEEEAARLGQKTRQMAKLFGKKKWVFPGTYHHRIPVFIREATAIFHGLCLLGAFWMVGDSFMLSSDTYTGLALVSFLLMVMTWITGSAGMGILFMASSVGTFYTAPVRGWPEAMAWLFLLVALFMLGRMLHEKRDRAVVCFSWVWAVGILLLIFWSAGDMLWQTLFFSLAASLTWMAGGAFRSYGLGAAALRFFGGIAVFAVLLEGSYGAVWANISGSYSLWILFLLFLAVDAVLLFRMAMKKEWLSVLAGLTPFLMTAAAFVSIFETSGALPATMVSVFCAILAVAVIARGVQMDRPTQRWGGIALLVGDGAIRVLDSALTFGQRGAFFLVCGVLAGLICYVLYLPSKRKKKSHVEPVVKEEEDHDE